MSHSSTADSTDRCEASSDDVTDDASDDRNDDVIGNGAKAKDNPKTGKPHATCTQCTVT